MIILKLYYQQFILCLWDYFKKNNGTYLKELLIFPKNKINTCYIFQNNMAYMIWACSIVISF